MLPSSPPTIDEVTTALSGHAGVVDLQAATEEAYKRILRQHLADTVDALSVALKGRRYAEAVRVLDILRSWRHASLEVWGAVDSDKWRGNVRFEYDAHIARAEAMNRLGISKMNIDAVKAGMSDIPLEFWSERAGNVLPPDNTEIPAAWLESIQHNSEVLWPEDGYWFYLVVDHVKNVVEVKGYPSVYAYACLVMDANGAFPNGARFLRSDGVFGVERPEFVRQMVDGGGVIMVYARRYYVPLDALVRAAWVSCGMMLQAAYRLEDDMGYTMLPVSAKKTGAPARSVYFRQMGWKEVHGEQQQTCKFWFKAGARK